MLLYAVIIAGVIIFYVRAYYLPTKHLNELKKQYQHAAEPRLMEQVGELDNEFFERVQRERARFVDAGNPWALKQNPVIPYWRNRAFTITWYGKEYDYSTVGMSQMEYHRAALKCYIELCEAQSRETGSAFTEEQMASAMGQKPFDIKKNVWQNN